MKTRTRQSWQRQFHWQYAATKQNITNESSKQNVNNNNLIVVLRRLNFVWMYLYRLYRCNAEHLVILGVVRFGSADTFGARVHLWNGLYYRNPFHIYISNCSLSPAIHCLLATKAMNARRGFFFICVYQTMGCYWQNRTKWDETSTANKRRTEKHRVNYENKPQGIWFCFASSLILFCFCCARTLLGKLSWSIQLKFGI